MRHLFSVPGVLFFSVPGVLSVACRHQARHVSSYRSCAASDAYGGDVRCTVSGAPSCNLIGNPDIPHAFPCMRSDQQYDEAGEWNDPRTPCSRIPVHSHGSASVMMRSRFLCARRAAMRCVRRKDRPTDCSIQSRRSPSQALAIDVAAWSATSSSSAASRRLRRR
jgi:hypothetical protein